MTTTILPMFGPAVEALPPEALRRRIQPDEQLIWWSHGWSRKHLYGLTHGRLLFSGLMQSGVSLKRDGGSGGAIHMLLVTGRRDIGNLRLQSRFIRPSPWTFVGLCLKGIANPLDIALLIKSTLKLDNIPIEDRSK